MSSDRSRPTPEELLARIKEEERESSRGKLKIFLGAAAGVGKTYAMLKAAQKLQSEHVDIVAGCVVTHGRKETEELLKGLEILPEKALDYKGNKLYEFDIDGTLARKPSLVLVDELAHTNAPGSRHEKRWQDIEELLDAGINVYTTLNAQHLESANDVVAQVTRVTVRETVPDSVFETAYEVELVDLPPDDLIQRFKEGKVYMPDQSRTALQNFFRKGNLIALRELALRCVAERVDAQMEKYRKDASISSVWPVADKLLVCVSPSPFSQRLIRATKRMATRLHSEWMAVWVETPASSRLPEKDRARVIRSLQLAESLGGEAVTVTGENPSEELVAYAQRRNVTKIIIGKPARPRWREILFGSVVDDLIRRSGDIDVYVITGESHAPEQAHVGLGKKGFQIKGYLYASAIVAFVTLIIHYVLGHLAPANIVMVYLLAVVITALRFSKGPSIFAAVLSVAAFDFFFIQPYFSFAVSDTEYLITFGVMLVVGLLLSTLTSRVKEQAESARQRERRTAALYALSREQATALTQGAVVQTSVKHIAEVFDCNVAVLLSQQPGTLESVSGLEQSFALDAKEMGVAQWVLINKKVAGAGTSTLPGSRAIYFPLLGLHEPIGVIGILFRTPDRLLSPEEMHLLETFVNQMALAAERALLTQKQDAPKTS